MFNTVMLKKAMNMEKKFREALLKVLQDGTFKNARALALAAEVDQGGLSRFLITMGYGGKGKSPKIVKASLSLQTVSRLVDSMGGTLTFPWESEEACLQSQLNEAKKLITKKEEEIKELQAKYEALEDILLKSISPPVEIRENKNSA